VFDDQRKAIQSLQGKYPPYGRENTLASCEHASYAHDSHNVVQAGRSRVRTCVGYSPHLCTIELSRKLLESKAASLRNPDRLANRMGNSYTASRECKNQGR